VEKQKNLLRLKEKLNHKLLMFLIPTVLLSNEDSLDYDIWSDASWDTITYINEIEAEVEQIVSVAGVRGSEAKNEILKYLWYRKRAKRNG